MTKLQVEVKEKDSQLSSFKNDMEEREGLLHRLQEAMLSAYEQEVDSLIWKRKIHNMSRKWLII